MKGNFNTIINGEQPVLVDFYADWCGPCKSQAPIIGELAKTVEGKVRIIKIDVDRNQTLSTKYQIRGVPTLALFHKGAMLWKASGVHSKEQLLQVLQQNLS